MIEWDSNIISGVIGFGGSVIGGLFTLWGVNRTLKIQNKEKLRDEFPVKINNIYLLIDELTVIRENKENKYNYIFDGFYNASQSNRPKRDDEIFNNLINVSTKIDDEVYKKIKQLIDSYYKKYDEGIAIYSSGIIIFDEKNQFNEPKIGLNEDSSNKIRNLVDQFKKELKEIIEFLRDYKVSLEKDYFNN